MSALEKLQKFKFVSAEEYIKVDSEDQSCEELSDEAIVQLVTNRIKEEIKDEEDNEPEPVIISSKEASTYAHSLRLFFEQANNTEALAFFENTITPAIEQFILQNKTQSTLNTFFTKNN